MLHAALIFCLTMGATPAASTRVTSIPAPVGLEAKLIDDAQHNRLDASKLLEASLIASGVPDAEVASEAKRVRAALAPAIARAKTQRTARQRGAVLLQALHETVFRTYVVAATEIDGVERTGEYNCLSSAVLFVVAADGLLDHPRGMLTRLHAFARVDVDGRAVDVETTSPQGFDADRKKLITREYAQEIAGKGVTPEEVIADLSHPEELPVSSLVAGVYNNRSVGISERGDVNAAAIVLDRGERLASGALKARMAAWHASLLNAGALSLVEQNRFDEARVLLELALDGTDGTTRADLTGNLASVHLSIAAAAFEKKDWTGGLAHVDIARKLGASDAVTAPFQSRANAALAALEGTSARCQADGVSPGSPKASAAAACLANLARTLTDKGDLDTGLQMARRAYALDPKGDSVHALFFALFDKGRAERDAGHCDAVEPLAREADLYRAAVEGQKWSAAKEAGGCWAKLGEKAFVKGDWVEAGRLYRRALVHLPDEEIIRSNVARADLNIAIGLAEKGQCGEARALAKRSAHTEPSLTELATQLLESCAIVRASKAADAKDWATATLELRRGLVDAPGSQDLNTDLGTAMHNLAMTFVNQERCDDARALVPELKGLKRDKSVEIIVKHCP
jgi:tetratricopeptide (TPR) repeat protein